MRGTPSTLDEFFSGFNESREIFDVLCTHIDALGAAEMRVTKSQVAFARARAFAWAWVPDRYLRKGHAPLVLTVSLRSRSGSARWKSVVQTSTNRYTHHVELWSPDEIDAEVDGFLKRAWAEAE